jgi:limonene-1,2-epoxide hydrolase
MSSMEQTLATIERFNEAFNRHDLDTVLQLMTDDIVFENTSNGRFEGQVAVRGVLSRAFEILALGWFETEEMFACEDRCVVRWVYTFNREDPTRENVRGVDLFRVRNAKVAEKLSYVKSGEFVQKLGLQIPRT